jgi:hydrogenase/urease accessory protein HupE
MLMPPALAHRLNEYLEATTINFWNGNILLEMRLTSGVDVANEILNGIDLNGDHLISVKEESAYMAQLGREISFSLDGVPTMLIPVSFSFPTMDAMRKGIGDIIVKYEIHVERSGIVHHLKLINKHHNRIAVYLVNCLMPSDTSIHVVSQNRNVDQSAYQLYFTTGSSMIPNIDQQKSIQKVNHKAVLKTYFIHGIRHILTGYDHLLFLCALVLGAAGVWDLIKIVTAFTIAHSITLTLATYGLAHVPPQIVEPVIAASIVFVAVQNMYWRKKSGGNVRLAIAFFFGLFHGLGFAGGLMELMHAMPTNLLVFAITGFSLGVEAGNQLVLLPLYGILQLLKRSQKNDVKSPLVLTFRRYTSGLVAIAGMYYLVIDINAWF